MIEAPLVQSQGKQIFRTTMYKENNVLTTKIYMEDNPGVVLLQPQNDQNQLEVHFYT